ncbi:MAG: penicillin acylase family protein, partial [Proteobacteria bacterium]|nr:penicillin acylase family protein [Pseudomonadota bacterium]
MRRAARLALRALLGVLLLLIVAAGGVAALVWRTIPGGNEQAAIPGLSAPVSIRFDGDGIPWIRAATETDAAAALGFVHARDRMFQMELMRRNASGRLAELFGAAALPLDRMMRTLGVRQAADADYAALPARTRAMLDAYARGVNAWIAAHGRFGAPEFLLLGPPEPWRPQDSLLWAKTMGLWLSYNWRTELSRLSLQGKLPPERIGELWPPDGAPGNPQAMRAPLPFAARYAAAAARLLGVLPRFPSAFTLPGTASDEWAVDGAHSATGAPLLAGDPHLGFGFPGIWYLARIDTPDATLAGATAPGVPFLVLGRNRAIAWTFTTTGADVQDVFIETPTAGGDGYETPDGPRPFAVREERIAVRGAPDEILRVRTTRHGPVVSDLAPRADGKVLAVSMANLLPGDTAATGLFALNRAQSVAEAGKAAGLIASPVQNLLVADRAGIGLFVTGRVPIRRAGDGFAPVPGAAGAYDWTGFAGGEALPRYVAPASGRLVNGNERIAPRDFPVFLGRDWFGDWRARRIRALLDAQPAHTVAEFARMQVDDESLYAAALLPRLRAVPPPPGTAGKALRLLDGWDGRMAMDAPQPLIFNAWIDAIFAAVLDRAGVPENAAGPEREFVAYALSPAGAHWCGGDCDALLAGALTRAVADLSARYGADPAAWRWGAAHVAEFAHPLLSRLPVVGGLGVFGIATPGDDTTLDRGGTAPGTGFRSLHGASYRGVYDLADPDRSRFVVAPGQSGNPFSPHARFPRALARRRHYFAGAGSGAGGRDRDPDPRRDPMSYGMAMIEDDLLTRGVLTRRMLAWCVDLFLIAILVGAFWMAGLSFGIVTLGLGMPVLGLLPL